MLVAHWGKERLRDRPINLVLTLFILVLADLLLIARVALVTTFAFRRPVVYPEGIQRERPISERTIEWTNPRNYGAANR